MRYLAQVAGWAGLVGLGCGIGCLPLLAHTTTVAEDVAGTWHVEPDHNPRAGEPAIAWVALTRKGGAAVPLSEATCAMAVYSVPRQPAAAPLLQPVVKAMSAEQYRGIPGAEIVFPNPGIYQLELQCQPKTAESFQPFALQYDVTVGAGTAIAPASPAIAPAPAAIPSPTSSPSPAQPAVLLGAIALLSTVGAGIWLWRRGDRA